MRLIQSFALLAAVVLLPAAEAGAQFFAAPREERKLPPAFATAKRKLEIPFSVTQGTADNPVLRVEVLMSVDHGRNWFKYTEVPPDAGKFGFAVSKDMEVWLLTQTVTAKDARPKDDVKWPQMRVIVD